MNMSSVEVIDVPMSQLMVNMSQEPLPEGHPASHVTIREAWGMRDRMSPDEVMKMCILMEVFEGLTMGGLYDLSLRYETGALNLDEKSRIAAIKAVMDVF